MPLRHVILVGVVEACIFTSTVVVGFWEIQQRSEISRRVRIKLTDVDWNPVKQESLNPLTEIHITVGKIVAVGLQIPTKARIKNLRNIN